MPRLSQPDHLRRLAVLYLGMAHRADDVLTDAELESVTTRVLGRSDGIDRKGVQSIVMNALQQFSQGQAAGEAVQSTAHVLRETLTKPQRMQILSDLAAIAGADGVVLKHERDMLRSLSELWEVPFESEFVTEGAEPWGLLHDLAYIYLVLAHGTDNDFSETERQVILTKLREWQPEAPQEDVQRMLDLAMSEYAAGHDHGRLDDAISSVRLAMPRTQRMAALNDLVKIANADGVFLDDEEDLINRLQTEWDVDPSANYEPHSDKAVDG